MKTQHTPGPWRVHAYKVAAGQYNADSRDVGPHGLAVATVIGPFEKSWKDGPTCQADARLIAAAPELLAALQGLLAYPHPDATIVPVYGADAAAARDKLWCDAQNAARAAITKATE